MALIHEVAKKAGVSVATVSKALSDKDYKISGATRRRVLEAMEALGYAPNVLGRSLIKQKSTVLVAGFAMINESIAGMYEAAAETGCDIILLNAGVMVQNDYLEKLKSRVVDGAIFNNLIDEETLVALAKKYPLVQCGEYSAYPKAVSVSIDNEKAAYEMTERMIIAGKRKFAFVTSGHLGAYTYTMAQERKKGLLRALEAHGLPYFPELTREFPYGDDYDGAVAIAAEYAAMPDGDRPDAVLCEQGAAGVACINAFRGAGLAVPGDVAVAGLDDVPLNVLSLPGLTSVRHPYRAMGREAVYLLRALLEGELDAGKHVYLDHTVTDRGSV
ncbi:LacI family transcriptional regulator [Oscillospiraceae bacterium OttesenSCG-928-F05]|nr:LacI family transcriptional regulator [Oscillospiraceae bacterium OttesenSCG-928-F05]